MATGLHKDEVEGYSDTRAADERPLLIILAMVFLSPLLYDLLQWLGSVLSVCWGGR